MSITHKKEETNSIYGTYKSIPNTSRFNFLDYGNSRTFDCMFYCHNLLHVRPAVEQIATATYDTARRHCSRRSCCKRLIAHSGRLTASSNVLRLLHWRSINFRKQIIELPSHMSVKPTRRRTVSATAIGGGGRPAVYLRSVISPSEMIVLVVCFIVLDLDRFNVLQHSWTGEIKRFERQGNSRSAVAREG